ncbi:MAG: glutamine--fructose-6-phosphate transaminase (isomerizing) [Planctomycetes bacterium]|nr:glutamine--fructose-6-phosphate transaminase (isomerizing) [Planctomycetota bacterium]
MCGIFGYVGHRDALKILMDGLKRLEYRGYDSSGVVVQNGHGLVAAKRRGRLDALEAEVRSRPFGGHTGLGHTRWATHGGVSDANAHPHFSCDGKIAVVHNGIIENFAELRKDLERRHRFLSGTDTEVIPHLVEELYEQAEGDILFAVTLAVGRLRGSWAMGVLHADHPNRLSVARVNCPLVLGLGDGENFLASDIPSLLPYTRRVIPLDENELSTIGPEGIQIFDRHLTAKARAPLDIDWTAEAAGKNGHPHFMAQEIDAQPRTVAAEVEAWGRSVPDLRLARDVDRVMVIACGTAWHAGLVAKAALEEMVRIPVEVGLASELRYGDHPFGPRTLAFAISQSGETADTLASVRMARESGSPILALTNVKGCTLAREADHVLYMRAGPETGVAATKSYTSQLVNILFLALHLGRERGTLSPERFEALTREAGFLGTHIGRILRQDPLVRQCARTFQEGYGFMFMGRRYNLATAYEGALKMKEITYLPSEGYGAGEMKHGPLSLVDERMVCVAITPRGRVKEKMISNIQEVRSRGGRIVSVATEGDHAVAEVSDHVFEIPSCEEMFSPILAVIPLQLLAYHRAVGLGRDVDRPRNLAKSVTVE